MATIIDNPYLAANERCMQYLATKLSATRGPTPWANQPTANAFLCSELPPGLTGVWCFLLFGGQEQAQNYEVSNPGTAFICDGILRGQFLGYDAAHDFYRRVMQSLPANQRSGAEKQVGGSVRLLEPTFHGSVRDEMHAVSIDGDAATVLVWTVEIPLRAVYINCE